MSNHYNVVAEQRQDALEAFLHDHQVVINNALSILAGSTSDAIQGIREYYEWMDEDVCAALSEIPRDIYLVLRDEYGLDDVELIETCYDIIP